MSIFVFFVFNFLTLCIISATTYIQNKKSKFEICIKVNEVTKRLMDIG